MTDDIVCLLQDLGKEVSVDVIAQFMLINPDVEELIAAKMGSLLSVPNDGDASAINQPSTVNSSDPSSSSFAQFLPDALGLASTVMTGDFHKMVFVVNMELNMGRGKQCAQVAHAALGLYLKIKEDGKREELSKINQWLTLGQKKIVLRGNNLQQIKSIKEEAEKANLPTILISDAGCTQIAPGSKTVLAIFGSDSEVNMVTGALKLL